MPKGMSDEQIGAWKGTIDNSLLEQDSSNEDQTRFEAGRSQFYDSSDSKATDALGSLLLMGAATAAGTGGAQLAGAVLGASDDALTGSGSGLGSPANVSKMDAMGQTGRDTRALSKAEKALEAATPDRYKTVDQSRSSAKSISRQMSPGTIYQDINDGFRVSPGLSKTEVIDPLTAGFKRVPATEYFRKKVGGGMITAIEEMPKISSDEVKRGIKAATEARDIAATTLEASKEAFKDVASRAVALQDAKITTGLKMFGKKAMATATIASSPALAAAVSALGIPIIAMGELAKHGKIDSMLETMSYRLLERPVAYGDVGDRVHSYLVQNPTEAEELYSKGAIDADYYEWVAESVGTAPDVIFPWIAACLLEVLWAPMPARPDPTVAMVPTSGVARPPDAAIAKAPRPMPMPVKTLPLVPSVLCCFKSFEVSPGSRVWPPDEARPNSCLDGLKLFSFRDISHHVIYFAEGVFLAA